MKMSWDYEKEIEMLTKELNSYKFESGEGRAAIRRQVAADCADISQRNGAKATANAIRTRYGVISSLIPNRLK